MKVKFDFNLNAWIQNLEIEADSEEQAKEKLLSMSLEDMVEAGAYIKASDVDLVDTEITEATYTVKVVSIDYAIDSYDVDELDEMSDEEVEAEIARVKASLPQELELEIECEPDDLDDYVADAISDETGWLINDCEYEIVSKR